jgi:hypothetical protein
MFDEEDYFSHAGVKGMKWGVRRAKKKPVKVGRRNYDARKLSNSDLRKVVARMELEQKYTQLNEKNFKKTGQGKKFTEELIKAARSKAAVAVVAGASAFAVGQAMKDPRIKQAVARFL